MAYEKDDSRGLIALICGIASFFTVPLIPAVVAIVLGGAAMSASPRGTQSWQFGQIGRILGILHLILLVPVFLLISSLIGWGFLLALFS